MHYVSREVSFDAQDIVLPVKIRPEARFSLALLVTLYTSGIGGAVFTTLTVWQVTHTMPDPSTTTWTCALLAFSLTAVFATSCTALHQKELLWSLLLSFDFGFNELQLASMHICICVLYEDWVVATCVAGASQLWMYWVLTLDALTPLMRVKLGFHVRFAVPIVVLDVL